MSTYKYDDADSSADTSCDDDSSSSSSYSNKESDNDPDWMRKFTRRPNNFTDHEAPRTAAIMDRVAPNDGDEDEVKNGDMSNFNPDWMRKFNKGRIFNQDILSSDKPNDENSRISKTERRERIRQNLRRLKSQKNRRRDNAKDKGKIKSTEIRKMAKDITESLKRSNNVAINSIGPAVYDQSIVKKDLQTPKNSNSITKKQNDKKIISKQSKSKSDLTKSSTNNSYFSSSRDTQQSNETNKKDRNKQNSKTAAPFHGVDQKGNTEAEAKKQNRDSRLNNNIPKTNERDCTTARTNYQAEIERSVPDNVMGMWGATVKSKKPNNATLMSHRVIKNQADRVKERIEKARKEAGSVNNNHVGEDTYAIDGKPGGIQVDEDTSASSSYFGQYGRQDSISMMDNSAAAMFGFHTTAKNEETEQNYKTESTTNKSRRQNSISMDNSAAALFGLRATTKNEDEDEANLKSESVDADIAAAALFYGAVADDTNTLKFKSQRIDDENKIGKKISQLSTQSDEKTSSVGDSDIDTIDIDDLLSDDDSDEKNAREHAQPPKKSWLDDSDSDDSSVDSEIEQRVALKSPVISPATNRSWLDHLKPDRSPVNNNSKQPEKKKSWLDDSDSDDSSSDSELGRKERPTASPKSPENKKSRLDDLGKKDKKTKKSKDGNDKESKKGDKKKIGKKEKSKSCDTKKKGKKVAKMIVDVSKDGRERKKNVKKKEKSREIPTKLEAGNFSASEFDYDFDDDVIQVHHKKKKKNYEPKEKRSKDTRKSNKKKSSKKKEKNK